jgi:uncharacterized RDD family membrane protein YckC
VEGRSIEVLPAFLGRDLHLDRRHGERDLGTPDGWLARIAPPPTIAPVALGHAEELPEEAPMGLRVRRDRTPTPARGVLSLRALAAPLPQQPAPEAPTRQPGPALELAPHGDAAAASPRVPSPRAAPRGTTMARAAASLGMDLPGSSPEEGDAEAAFFASAGVTASATSSAQRRSEPQLEANAALDVDLSGIESHGQDAAHDDVAGVHPVLRARPAALWRRLVASAVDGVLVLGVGALYLALAHLVTGRSRLDGVLLPALALLLLVAGVYAAVGSLWGGRTLGLHLAGIRLVDGRGQAPDPMRALVRTLLGGVSAALLGGGFWLALVDRRGQTLHDKLTSTFLVQPI